MVWFDVLVVGGGFGGALAARRLEQLLRGRPERVLLVAPENFMLRFDATARTALVRTSGGEDREVEFGAAIVAPGSVPATFPIPGLREHGIGFKTLADAIYLRNRVLSQLDAAEATTDLDHRRELLTFTFVGGGYAGVEAIAELESFAGDAVRRYRNVTKDDFRWVLVEARDGLLPGLDSRLVRYTERNLHKRGIEVHLGTRLESATDRWVGLSGNPVAPYRTGTLVWTAGQRPTPIAAGFGLPVNRQGDVVVDEYLRVEGHDRIFAVGDVAAVPDPASDGLAPKTAQHALRQAHVAANNVAAGFGVGEAQPYRYRDRGLAVTLGKRQGTAQVRRLVFTGPLAWWMGRSYHLLMMPGVGRKARVVTDWTLSLLFPRDVASLGQLGKPSPLFPDEE
jgi:NADH dehydrogenase